MLKLTDAQAAEIVRRYQAGFSQQAVADEFGVSQSLVSQLVRGKLRVRPRIGPPAKGLITDEGRECSRCGEFKLWSEFSPYRRAGSLTGYMSACKECRRLSDRGGRREGTRFKDAATVKGNVRRYYLKSKYGLTVEQYNWLAAAQGHKCALCGEPEHLRRRVDKHGVVREVDLLGVDHNHNCSEHLPQKACIKCIRGLLCDDCNRLLGFAERKASVAVRFADYLTQRPFLEVGDC